MTAAERRYEATAWDTVAVIGIGASDTLFQLPRLLSASDSAVFAYDYFSGRVLSFTWRGDLRWTFGRQGQGPDEFSNVMDLAVTANGDLLVLDPPASRISVLSDSGTHLRSIPLQGLATKDVIPAGDRLVLAHVASDIFASVIDSLGTSLGEIPFPSPELADLDPFVRQTVVDQRGQAWVVGFPFGDRFFVFEGGERVHCQGRLIEGRFPTDAETRAAGTWTPWLLSVALTDSSVLVLAGGPEERRGRVLDEYARSTCQYQRSRRLPGRFITMTAGGSLLAFEAEELLPVIWLTRLE